MVGDTSIIEMHDTWLVVNSIVGCTNGCKYCFLQATKDNLARPRILADAAKAISCLFSSKYYTTNIPVCLLPNTDPFLNETNTKYVKEMLDILAKNKISNPIILITKCLIPNEFVEFLSDLIKDGMNIVVYLSLSGLSKFFEPNINHENIKINFCNLASKGIKIIHYYRPFIPENSDAKSITNILDFVSQYTNVSVITGLKLKSDFIDKIDFWNITSTEKEKCLNASGVWPESAYNYFSKDYKHTQNVFQMNACALAQILEIPSPQYYGTHECKHCNKCSAEQRARCAAFKKDTTNIKENLIKELQKLNKYNDAIEIFQNEHALIIKNSELTTGDCAFLSYILGIKVTIERKRDDDNYFNSPFTNTESYIVK